MHNTGAVVGLRHGVYVDGGIAVTGLVGHRHAALVIAFEQVDPGLVRGVGNHQAAGLVVMAVERGIDEVAGGIHIVLRFGNRFLIVFITTCKKCNNKD